MYRSWIPTPPILCLHFVGSLTVATQDSRPSGSLVLTRKALSSSTPCRFIPAHKYRHYTHPMKGDVKEKDLSPPLAGNQGVVTYIQPCLLIRGVFDVAALDRRIVQRRCQPQLIIQN